MSKPMTDLEIYDALHEAIRPLMHKTGETPHGDAVIKAAIKAISGLQLGLLMIEAKNAPPPETGS